jgi:glycosyltransferase involved in cell wall biosynthesis
MTAVQVDSALLNDWVNNGQMKSLRIAMLTTFYPPYSFGGDAIGIERLATSLAKRGHEITVVHDIDAYVTLAGQEPAGGATNEAINVIGLRSRFGKLSNLLTHQTGRPVVHRERLQKILSPGAFDVIWFHNVSLVGGLGVLSFGDGLKIYEAHEHWLVCPTHVLWRHNRELCDSRECIRCGISYRRPPQLWRDSRFAERQLNNVDAFIAKSEFSRRKHKEFGFSHDMDVVPYFLPDKPLVTAEDTDSVHSRPYFLFVGRLEKIKGLDDVIPVFRNYPEADLLIIGTGEYEQELKAQAAGIDNVRFVGRLPPDELSKYYQAAIALIVPSVCYETFGIILIESFREGTPVIAREIGPFVEIVNQCDGGILYADSAGLESAMRRLQGDPGDRSAMARAARAGFENWWSEESVINRYFSTLKRAAARNNRHELVAALGE